MLIMKSILDVEFSAEKLNYNEKFFSVYLKFEHFSFVLYCFVVLTILFERFMPVRMDHTNIYTQHTIVNTKSALIFLSLCE